MDNAFHESTIVCIGIPTNIMGEPVQRIGWKTLFIFHNDYLSFTIPLESDDLTVSKIKPSFEEVLVIMFVEENSLNLFLNPLSVSRNYTC